MGMENAVAIGALLKALGYGIPAAILVLGFLVLRILTQYTKNKQDKDRREHMAKWDSMVALQEKSITAQKGSMDNLINTHSIEIDRIINAHREEIKRIIDAHNEETDRHGKQFERQASALEALAHQISIQTQRLQERAFCPREEDDGK